MDHITLLDLAIKAAITAGKEILKIYDVANEKAYGL